jgi:hydroxypyruvate reductase
VLATAIELAGLPGVHILACDTDGVDGAAEIAGAYAGPEMLVTALRIDLDPRKALAHNDAHLFFEKTGGQVVTGPTLTNVNDFRAVLIHPIDA